MALDGLQKFGTLDEADGSYTNDADRDYTKAKGGLRTSNEQLHWMCMLEA